MNIRHAGKMIYDARKYMGLTQEVFAEGICEPVSLSRIETGASGVSLKTFRQFMDRANIPFTSFPEFLSKEDFEVFRMLKSCVYSIDSWQLNNALINLHKISSLNYGGNETYYALSLSLLAEIMLKSGYSDQKRIYSLLLTSLDILIPDMDYSNFSISFFDVASLRTLICLSQCQLNLCMIDESFSLNVEISSYLSSCNLSSTEKEKLIVMNSITRIEMFFIKMKYSAAIDLCRKTYNKAILENLYYFLPEIQLWESILSYKQNMPIEGLTLFNNIFFLSHGLMNGYSNIAYKLLTSAIPYLHFSSDKYPYTAPEVFYKELYNQLDLDLETYTLPNQSIELTHYTVGNILFDCRTASGLTQTQLCQGLCTKSHLSKIENGTITPDCFLLESLLYRLGLQSNLITVYSSKEDIALYCMKQQITNLLKVNINYDLSKERKEYLAKIKKGDTLNQQWLMLTENYEGTYSPDDSVQYLNKCLQMTLPNFEIERILEFRLTYNECVILVGIAEALSNSLKTHSQAEYIYTQLLLYFKKLDGDSYILTKSCFVVIRHYIMFLYHKKRYSDLVLIFQEYIPKFGLHDLRQLSSIYFYVCQSLFELEHSDAQLSAKIATGLCNILERQSNSTLLQEYIKKDFGIDI